MNYLLDIKYKTSYHFIDNNKNPTSDNILYKLLEIDYPKSNNFIKHKDFQNDYEYNEKFYFLMIILKINLAIYFLFKNMNPVLKFIVYSLVNILLTSVLSKIVKLRFKPRYFSYSLKYIIKNINYCFFKYTYTSCIFDKKLKEKYNIEQKFIDKYDFILSELNHIINNHQYLKYTLDSNFGSRYNCQILKNKLKNWKIMEFKIEGRFVNQTKTRLPLMYKLLNNFNIRNAGLLIFDSDMHIPIHCGNYKGYLRYFFCLNSNYNSFMYVNKNKYIFREKQGILFDDCFPNEIFVENKLVLLYLDVLRNIDSLLLNLIYKCLVHIMSYSNALKKNIIK